jgi:hypothetical protein
VAVLLTGEDIIIVISIVIIVVVIHELMVIVFGAFASFVPLPIVFAALLVLLFLL